MSEKPASEGDSNHQEFRSRVTFGSLNGVRALSILAVIWHHSGAGAFGTHIEVRGFLGVDMFFVLSGFLIVTLLLRERRRHGQISLKNFYARRTLRIFPIYYIMIGVTAAFAAFSREETASEYYDAIPYLLLYVSNWYPKEHLMGVAWSLATEEQFYLFWPPIERFLKSWWWVVLVIGLVVNQAINFGLLSTWLAGFQIQIEHLAILQCTFTPILMGVGLAHMLDRPRGFAFLYRLVGHRFAPLIVTIVLGVTLLAPVDDIQGGLRLLYQCIMTVLLAALVVREDHVLEKFMQWRPFDRIGTVSYGMYLFHLLVTIVLDVVLGRLGWDHMLVLFALTVVVTYVLSELSFRWVERPFLRLKHHFVR